MLGLVALMVGLFYANFLSPDLEDSRARFRPHRYYDLQVRAWLDGRLDLPMPLPPEFLALPDPYDPASNERFRMAGEYGIHDLSFYRGKVYMYWGPVPALFTFLPWRVITGVALPSAWAGWTFAFGGWLMSAMLLTRLQSRQWPLASPVLLGLALLALGTCNWVAVLLARCTVYEVPILAAAARRAPRTPRAQGTRKNH